MTDTLIETAKIAGLRDPDLLKLARTDVPPQDAVRELRTRYPAAFESMAQLAAEFSLVDLNAVALARTDCSPRQAMQELREHYPQAFKPPFDARTATPAERVAGWTKLQAEENRRFAAQMHLNDMARLEARFGKKG